MWVGVRREGTFSQVLLEDVVALYLVSDEEVVACRDAVALCSHVEQRHDARRISIMGSIARKVRLVIVTDWNTGILFSMRESIIIPDVGILIRREFDAALMTLSASARMEINSGSPPRRHIPILHVLGLYWPFGMFYIYGRVEDY